MKTITPARWPLIVAGITLTAAALVFWASEAITAAGWPGYSYLKYFISDLGVPTHGTNTAGAAIYSPRAVVLNIGWVINALLVLVSAVIMRRFRRPTTLSRWQWILTIGYVLGLIDIANFHESPRSMLLYHTIGAVFAIAGGNVAVLLAGLTIRSQQGSRGFARFFTIMGIVGIIATLLAFAPLNLSVPGLLERFAAYPVLLAQVVGGIAIIANAPRLRNRRSASGASTYAISNQPA